MSDSSVLRRYGLVPESDGVVDDEAESTLNLGAFGWLRGVRERAVMLELRKRDGHILAVGYGWLERIEFDPSAGIILTIVNQKITIRGRKLNSEVRPQMRLFEGLTRHRVPWIQEADQPTQIAATPEATVVEQIQW